MYEQPNGDDIDRREEHNDIRAGHFGCEYPGEATTVIFDPENESEAWIEMTAEDTATLEEMR